MDVELETVEVPDFGIPEVRPELGHGIHSARMDAFRGRLADRGYDVGLVYADREHSANLSYLTGFDPRFEEALFIVGPTDLPLLLTGNECFGMAEAAPGEMRVELFQDFSLPAQPRDRSRPLEDILRSEGVRRSSRVALIGWKECPDRSRIELPAFIVDAVRGAVAPTGVVENAGDILTSARDGLRVINEVDQLAAFEYEATRTSSGVRNLIVGLEPGMREDDAVSLLGWHGAPLSCHLMLSSGDRATLGLLGPGDRRIQRGDRFTTAYGVWGALNCRAGFVAEGPEELPAGVHDYVERLVAPYFAAIAEWYEALHVGQTGGSLHEIIDRHLGNPFFGVFLNAGHQIHLDEWVNSPVCEGSEVELASGMALQVDVIPATGTDYFTTNIEDGIALADEQLRTEIAARYPGMWSRIGLRRTFMRDVIGIDLHPDVLPLSNMPAVLNPYLLRSDLAMAIR